MTISLTPELDEFVHKQIKSGRFASASEVVRAGLRLLSDEEEDREVRRASLREWIQQSIDDPRPSITKDQAIKDIWAYFDAKQREQPSKG